MGPPIGGGPIGVGGSIGGGGPCGPPRIDMTIVPRILTVSVGTARQKHSTLRQFT